MADSKKATDESTEHVTWGPDPRSKWENILFFFPSSASGKYNLSLTDGYYARFDW